MSTNAKVATNDILMDASTSDQMEGLEFDLDDSFFDLGRELDEVFADLPRNNRFAFQVDRLHALARTHLEQCLMYCEKAARISVLDD